MIFNRSENSKSRHTITHDKGHLHHDARSNPFLFPTYAHTNRSINDSLNLSQNFPYTRAVFNIIFEQILRIKPRGA
jgi:hypothetical protein